MTIPDLRILALVDAKLFPPDMQEAFDHWRIWRARDAVANVVRKRQNEDFMLNLMLERLEVAEDEAGIFEGIYALSEMVDLHRGQLGLHSEYIIMIMSGQLNPYGLLAINPDFVDPPPIVVSAAEELWRLAAAHKVDVPELLKSIEEDDTLEALNEYYTSGKTPDLPPTDPLLDPPIA